MSVLPSGDQAAIVALYRGLLDAWNRRAADEYGARFALSANVVGFDGSQMNGPAEVTEQLRTIFAHHPTAAYVGIVRKVRFLGPDVALLRAVAGMVPPGQSDLNPAVNAVQTLVAVRAEDGWRIELFQNTPAAFHGRPDLSESLTQELRRALKFEGESA